MTVGVGFTPRPRPAIRHIAKRCLIWFVKKRGGEAQPRWGWTSLTPPTQGSSFLATAGLRGAIPLGLLEFNLNVARKGVKKSCQCYDRIQMTIFL